MSKYLRLHSVGNERDTDLQLPRGGNLLHVVRVLYCSRKSMPTLLYCVLVPNPVTSQ